MSKVFQSLSMLFTIFIIELLGGVFVGNEGVISSFTRNFIANVSCGNKGE